MAWCRKPLPYTLTNSSRPHDSFPRAFGLYHNSFQFQSPADIQGSSLKKKLESAKSFEQSKPFSLLTASANELLPKPHSDSPLSRRLAQLPFHPRTFGSPRSDHGPMDAVPTQSAPFQQHGGMDYRSTLDPFDPDHSPRTRTRNNSDDASSTQGSYDYGYAEDMNMDETSEPERPKPSERYASVRQKRRAASPPPSENAPLGLQGKADLVIRRNELASRGSPTPRLTNTIRSPLHCPSRSNSYMPMSSGAPSISTTAYERQSPSGSPGGVSPMSATSPNTTPLSLHPSLHSTFNSRTTVHTRNGSSADHKKLPELQKPLGTKGFLMCERCLQKPKKFETREELR
jgi:hypothetical protein